MNKKRVAEVLASRTGITLSKAMVLLDDVLDAVMYGVATDGQVSMTGFGVLEKIDRAPRTARNPQTGETVEVPSKVGLRFRPGQGFQDIVNGRKPLEINGRIAKKWPKGTFTPVDANGKAIRNDDLGS